ncbi:MAG: protein phosphatase 2C domain-containing protein [Lachnospiraceae bacterium]|nr:protein phosphatase 2C domain-containing protein [Lachnospiraceae bacterium]
MGISIFGDWAQGASHNRAGIEWQDYWRKIDYIKGVSIVAVADGHGSDKCPYSAEGAKIATKVFCNLMSEYYNSYDDLDALETFLNREGDVKLARTIDLEWKDEVLSAQERCGRDIELPEKEIHMLYGTTLLGMMIVDSFVFTLQIGDGDILYVDGQNVSPMVDGDRLLGVETHSLSSVNAWKNAVTGIMNKDMGDGKPYMYMLTTDGFSNSFANKGAYYNTCREYYEMIRQHGIRAVKSRLKEWLRETSEYGCGDDITAVFAYVD